MRLKSDCYQNPRPMFDTQNRLLTALPAELLEDLSSDLERVPLAFRAKLNEPGIPATHVYFPESAVLSMISTMDDGTLVEVATVGKEGMDGMPVLLGGGTAPISTICQVPGVGLRITAERFRELARTREVFTDVLHRYTQALMVQMAQNGACNRVHPIDERCARWLLMTHDRVGEQQFELTQEFLAIMLGSRRPAVSVAASTLQRAGLIRYTRGRVTVLDRDGLESASCGCYRIITSEYERLLSNAPRSAGDPESSP